MIDNRWDKQLHAAGYFLNPRFQYRPDAGNDNEALTGFKHVVERMVPDIRKQIAIHNEVESYKTKGSFGSNLAYEASEGFTPARWWSMVGREMAPNLTELALLIKQPILFLSGLQDEMVPPYHMRMLHSKAVETNKNCLFVDFPSGMHMDTWLSGGDRYWRTIQLFLDRYVPEIKRSNLSHKVSDAINKDDAVVNTQQSISTSS